MGNRSLWQYDEFRQIGTDYGSLEEIRIYDQRMQKIRDVRREVQDILDKLAPKEDQTFLEMGTGTGELAIAAAERCSRVFAVDISAPMLKYAEQKAIYRGVRNIEFVQGGFLTYHHQGPPLDFIASQLALHHLPDFWKQVGLLRLSKMLKEGGKFYLMDAVYSFQTENYQNFFQNLLTEMAKTNDGKPPRDVIRHIKEEHSTMNWILEGMLARAGFEINDIDYKNGFISTYLCTKIAP